MKDLQRRQMPKGYSYLWGGITLAYLVWLVFLLRDTVLTKYETVAERTVDGLLYNDITGFVGHHWLYPIWVVVSALTLLAYLFYLKDILYAERLGNFARWFCLVGSVVGCVYVVAFCFLSAPNRYGDPATFTDKLQYVTASMIGLVWPWLFKLWGILTAATLFSNIMYCYRKYDYNSKLGVILGSLGATAIYLSLNCPSMGETKDFTNARCTAHWAGALIFAVCIAAPLVIFLFHAARERKGKFLWAFVIFVALLALMVVLLVTVGKSAMIENIPIVAGYILLYMLNFTKFFETNNEVA